MFQLHAAGSSELRLRILSSVALGAVALGSAWLGGWLLAIVWLGAAVAVVHEWTAMTRTVPLPALSVAGGVGLAAIQGSWILGTPLVFACAVAAAVAALAAIARTGRDRAWAVAGLAYAAPVALVPVMFRVHPGGSVTPLLWMFAVVWTTDVAAYFVGRAVGGPKLWPAVSPNKTWSGFAGGLVGAMLAGAAVAALGAARPLQAFDLGALAVLSGLASVASQAGDLAESAMKRHFGVKDSGSLIPGHGGFMDRLDGFAAVAILVLLLMPFVKTSFWAVAP